MLDKAMYLNEYEIVLIYSHREPVRLYSSTGKVLELLEIIMLPVGSQFTSYSEYLRAVSIGEEDTQVIDITELSEAG